MPMFVVTAGQNGEALGSDESEIIYLACSLFDVDKKQSIASHSTFVQPTRQLGNNSNHHNSPQPSTSTSSSPMVATNNNGKSANNNNNNNNNNVISSPVATQGVMIENGSSPAPSHDDEIATTTSEDDGIMSGNENQLKPIPSLTNTNTTSNGSTTSPPLHLCESSSSSSSSTTATATATTFDMQMLAGAPSLDVAIESMLSFVEQHVAKEDLEKCRLVPVCDGPLHIRMVLHPECCQKEIALPNWCFQYVDLRNQVQEYLRAPHPVPCDQALKTLAIDAAVACNNSNSSNSNSNSNSMDCSVMTTPSDNGAEQTLAADVDRHLNEMTAILTHLLENGHNPISSSSNALEIITPQLEPGIW